MRVRSVKVNQSLNKYAFKWSESQNSGESWSNHESEWPDRPTDALFNALEALKPWVISSHRLDPSVAGDLEVTGVSVSYSGENTAKFVARGKLKVKDCNSPENINTAWRFLWCEEEESVGLVSAEIRRQVELVLETAELFINGERLQMVLPLAGESGSSDEDAKPEDDSEDSTKASDGMSESESRRGFEAAIGVINH